MKHKSLFNECCCQWVYYIAGLTVFSFSLGAMTACVFFAKAIVGSN